MATSTGHRTGATEERLSASFSGRNNSMGFLRVVFAGLVIFSHAFPIGGWGEDPTYHLWNEQADVSQLGLLGFFALSGFLVTRSARRRDALQYFWARFLRIYPAYFVVLLAGALIVGPWFFARDNGGLSGYWGTQPDGPVTYITHNLALEQRQRGIADVWRDLPHGEISQASVLNGSLWTLYWEFLCYVLVGGLALTGLLVRARIVVPLLALLLTVGATVTLYVPDVGWSEAQGRIFALISIFLMGATMELYAEKISVARRWGLLAVFLIILTLHTELFTSVGYAAFAYLTLWLSVHLPSGLHRVGTRTDLTYGLYIYAWPVAMGLADYGVPSSWGYVIFVLLTYAITVPLAWLSWHFVERPAMALKDWGPGRGVKALRAQWRPTSSEPT